MRELGDAASCERCTCVADVMVRASGSLAVTDKQAVVARARVDGPVYTWVI